MHSTPSILPSPHFIRLGIFKFLLVEMLFNVLTPVSPNFSASGKKPTPKLSSTVKKILFRSYNLIAVSSANFIISVIYVSVSTDLFFLAKDHIFMFSQPTITEVSFGI